MSENSFLEDARRQAGQAAGPEGLSQRSTVEATAQTESGSFLERARDWYTGGSSEGTGNGWNTDFQEKFIAGQTRASDEGTLNDYYRDAEKNQSTGVVLWDHGATNPDGSREFAFGDVYEDGQFIGNLYDEYDEDTADLMMADWAFDATSKSKFFEAGTLHEEVSRYREQQTSNAEKFEGARQHREDVDELTKEWSAGAGDEVGSILGGAAGGAATGAGIGTAIGALFGGAGAAPGAAIGAVAGGIIGGIGSFLNRDELTNLAAQTSLKIDMGYEEGGFALAAGEALSGWGSIGAKLMSPTANLSHAGWEVAQGGIGDGVVDWYAVDPATGESLVPGWLQAVELGSGFVDAVGQWANPISRTAYSGILSMQIGGAVVGAAGSGGLAFNERSGSFENFVVNEDGSIDWGSLTAGIVNIGIDAVQLGMGRGMIGKATNMIKREERLLANAGDDFAKVNGLDRLLFGRSGAQATQTVQQGAWKYGLNEAGEAVTRRATLQMLAPSELVNAIGAGASARWAARGSRNAIGANDYYMAANQLANGNRVWTAMLLNGWGEGMEEGVQAIAEPMMFDDTASYEQIVESFLRGAVMGAGMTAGTMAGAPSRQRMEFAQAYGIANALRSEDPISVAEFRKDWDSMNETQRQQALNAPPAIRSAFQRAAQHMENQHKRTFAAGVRGVEAWHEMLEARTKEALKRAQPATDTTMFITQLIDASMPMDSSVTSVRTLVQDITNHLEGMRLTTVSDNIPQEMRDEATAVLERSQEFLQWLQANAGQAVAAAEAGDRTTAQTVLRTINSRIREMYEMRTEGGRADAKLVSLLFSRFPLDGPGNVQARVPQASLELTMRGNDALRQVSDTTLTPMGGDYDGDKIRLMGQHLLDDGGFNAVRMGMGFLGSGAEGLKANIPATPYETYEFEYIQEALEIGGSAERQAAESFIKRVKSGVLARYGKHIARPDLDGILEDFEAAVRAGDGSARLKMTTALLSRHSKEMSIKASESLTNEPLQLAHLVLRHLQDFQGVYSSIVRAPGAGNTQAVQQLEASAAVVERRAARASSEMAALKTEAPAESLFRAMQSLHHAALNATELGRDDQINIPQLEQFTQMYAVLNRNVDESALEKMDPSRSHQMRALQMLNALVDDVAQTVTSVPRSRLRTVIANTRIADVVADGNGKQRVVTATVAQTLLRRALESEQAVQASTGVEPAEAVRTRWAKVRGMLAGGHEETAFVEVMGSLPLYELIGDSAAALGSNMTLEQSVALLSMETPTQRADSARLLRLSTPGYDGKGVVEGSKRTIPYRLQDVENGNVTAERSAIDSIIGAANKRLSLRDDFLAGGELGDYKSPDGGGLGASARQQEMWVSGARHIISYLDTLTNSKSVRFNGSERFDRTNREHIAELLNSGDRDFGDLFFSLVNPDIANALQTNQGEFYSDWLVEMFAIKDPEEMVFHYWKNTLIAELDSLGGQDALRELDGDVADSRLRNMHVRYIYDLANRADGGVGMMRYFDMLDSATSVYEFIKWVNRERGAESVPLTAWSNDVALYDPNEMTGMVSNDGGRFMREAAASFQNKATALSKRALDAETAAAADADVARQILEGLDNGDRAALDMERRLSEVLAHGWTTMTSRSPAILHESVLNAIVMAGDAHTKGKVPTGLQASGAVESRVDSLEFATAQEALEHMLGSHDIRDLSASINIVGDEVRFTLDNGEQGVWRKPGSVREFLELYTSPRTRPLMQLIAFPQAWESTGPDGRISKRFILQPSLKELASGALHRQVTENTYQSDGRFASIFDGEANQLGLDAEFARSASRLAIARTSGAVNPIGNDATDRAADAIHDMVGLYRRVGELAAKLVGRSGDTSEVQKLISTLVSGIRERNQTHVISTLLGIQNPTRDEEVLSESLFKTWTTDYIEREAQRAKELQGVDPEAAQRILDNADSVVERVQTLRKEDPFAEVEKVYALPDKSDAVEYRKAQHRLLSEVIDHGQLLSNRVPAAAEAVSRLQAHMGRTSWMDTADPSLPLPILYRDEARNDEAWALLSRSMTTMKFADLFAAPGSQVTLTEMASDPATRQLLDPSFAYLIENLADPAVIQAALNTTQRLTLLTEGSVFTTTDPISELRTYVENVILDDKRLGAWTELVPEITAHQMSMFDAEAAGVAVQQAGLTSEHNADLDAHTQRNQYIPPNADEFLSLAEFSAGELDGSLKLTQDQADLRMYGTDPMISTSIADPGTAETPGVPVEEVEQRMEVLSGRFAASVTLTYVDPVSKEQQSVNIWDHPRASVGMIPSRLERIAASKYRYITPRNLKTAVEQYLTSEGLAKKVRMADVTVQVEYFHPDSQPADVKFANSALFEGMSAELDADPHMSLVTPPILGNRGLKTRATTMALDAVKTGRRAVRRIGRVKADAPGGWRNAELGWETNLSDVLMRKAVQRVRTDFGDGVGAEPATDVSAYYKREKLRHFVRGFEVDSETGERTPVMLMAEEVIEQQRRGTFALENAELYVPSIKFLRTMMGAASGTTRTPLRSLPRVNRGGAISQWNRTALDAALRRFPEMLKANATNDGFAEVDVYSTALTHQAYVPTMAVRSTTTSQQRTDFEAGLRIAAKRRDTTYAARDASRSNNREWRETAEQQLQSLLERILQASDTLLMSDIDPTLPNGVLGRGSKFAQALAKRIEKKFGADPNRRTWELRVGGRENTDTRASGVLTDETLFNEDDVHDRDKLVMGDHVWIDAEMIERNFTGEQREKLMRNIMRELANRRVTVIIMDGGTGGDVRGALAQHARKAGLVGVGGSEYIFEAPQYTSHYADVAALESTLMTVDPIIANESMLIAASRDTAIAENAGALINPDTTRRVGVITDVFPTNVFHRFNVPAPERRAAVRAKLEALVGPDDKTSDEYLARLLGTADKPAKPRAVRQFKKELTASMAKWAADDVLHETASTLEPGDFLPLQDERTGEIILARHGHKQLNWAEASRQLQERLVGASGHGVAIATGGVDEQLTSRSGKILDRINLPNGMVQYRMSRLLSEVGSKLYFNTFKIVTTTAEGLDRMMNTVIPGWNVDVVVNHNDLRSKQIGGVLNNFREWIGFAGADFVPDVAESLFGVKNFSQLPEDQQRLTRVTVTDFLSQMAVHMPRISLRRARSEIEAIRTGRLSEDFGNLIVDKDVVSIMAGTQMSDASVNLGMLTGKELLTPQEQITMGILTYLATGEGHLQNVLTIPGVADFSANGGKSSNSWKPESLFTDLFDGAAFGSKLRTHMLRKIESRLSPAVSGQRDKVILHDDLSVTLMTGAKKKNLRAFLAFGQVVANGDSPVFTEDSIDRAQTQQVSRATVDIMQQTTGAATSEGKGTDKVAQFALGVGVEAWDRAGGLQRVLRKLPASVHPGRPWERLNAAERWRVSAAAAEVGSYRGHPINTASWKEDTSEHDFDQQLKTFEARRAQVAHSYGLRADNAELVDGWIRQIVGKPWSETGEDVEISYHMATQAIDIILSNYASGALPTHFGMVPAMHHTDLWLLWQASQSGKGVRLLKDPLRKQGDVARPEDEVHSWDQWQAVALGMVDIEDQAFDPLYLLAVDGFMHTYTRSFGGSIGMPTSYDQLVAGRLLDPTTGDALISLDPNVQAIAREADIVNAGQLSGTSFDSDFIFDLLGAREAPAGVLKKRLGMIHAWRAKNSIAKPTQVSMKTAFERGSTTINEGTTQNAIARIAIHLRVITSLLNPFLYISAWPEAMVKNQIETITNLLTGDAVGGLGQAASAAGAAVGLKTRYSVDQQRRFRNTITKLSHEKQFRDMMHADLLFQQDRMNNAHALERGLVSLSRMAGRWQDPTYGMLPKKLGELYVASVLREVANGTSTGGREVSPEFIMAQLENNPKWVQRRMPELHQAAMSTIANSRNLKVTLPAMIARSVYEPMSNRPGASGTFSTLFLKLPMMFATYGANIATTIFGMQGPMTALAALFHGQQKSPFIRKIQASMRGDLANFDPNATDVFDMSEALEGLDLTKVFVQSGVTHTGLMAAGLLAGGLGLSGEDEEDRRRRKAAQYQGTAYAYDPRKIQNDWRNSQAVFLDWLPFNLDSYFTVTAEDSPSGQRSMANLHWILKQFISPLIGIEKFMETGDTRQIMWGFEDAINSFPLVNENTYLSALKTYDELMSYAAEEEALGTPESLQNAYYFMVSAVSALEGMLFENSFINLMYVGKDDYDRDPWVRPETDAEGQIVRNEVGVPQDTEALQSFENADGDVQQGYVSRDAGEAAWYQLAENRASFAFMASLFTGQWDPRTSQFNRDNMAVKTRSVDNTELSQAEAEGLILSSFSDSGAEILTQDGARAVLQGLWKGTVQMSDESLRGVYIPYDMRVQISAQWQEELIQQGIDMGLEEWDAKALMWDIWKGDETLPNPVGLESIIWSDEISAVPSTQYYQLNTTYVTGPDGRPWATGVTRDSLNNAFGLTGMGLNKYYAGEKSNIGVDSRLNSADAISDLNTGQRALTRVDESWDIPSLESMLDEVNDNLEKILKKDFSPSDTSGGGFGYGGGGGGGGYSSRLYAPQDNDVPYSNTAPMLNSGNPYVRRANIRRERYSNQRGRLKPWQ